jgi:hypothetical protein
LQLFLVSIGATHDVYYNGTKSVVVDRRSGGMSIINFQFLHLPHPVSEEPVSRKIDDCTSIFYIEYAHSDENTR